MSEFEIREVQNFILQVYRLHGKGLEKEEWESAAWIKYLELRKMCGGKIYLYYDWKQIYDVLRALVQELKRHRNEQFHFESKLSLNASYSKNGAAVESWLRIKSSDFVNQLALWDYVRRLGTMKYNVIKRMYDRETDEDIAKELDLPTDTYNLIKRDLRVDFMEYLEM